MILSGWGEDVEEPHFPLLLNYSVLGLSFESFFYFLPAAKILRFSEHINVKPSKIYLIKINDYRHR